MPAIVSYLYNEVPGLCWGSPERVADWPRACDQLRTTTEKLNRRITPRHDEKSGSEPSEV
jgi:hypothetical protein